MLRPLTARTGALLRGRRLLSSVPTHMRAVVVHDVGGPEVLKLEEAWPVPSLAAGEVLVKNTYLGLNFIDTYHRGGLYPRDLPFVAGSEGAGEIVALSAEAAAEGAAIGDRVAYQVRSAHSEYTAVPAAKLVPVPSSIGLDVATAACLQGLTAHYLVTDAHAGIARPGDWMLVHGVGGGTCQWAAQMARLKGYRVIGTCARGKEDIARATACDKLIVLDEAAGTAYEDYLSCDIVGEVMAVTGGEGVRAAIDGIGKSTLEISLACLARRGILVSFGNASGAVPAFPVLRLIGKSNFVTRPKLEDYVEDRDELLMRAREVFGWIAAGELSVRVDQTFPLADAAEGHGYLEAGRSTGKILYSV